MLLLGAAGLLPEQRGLKRTLDWESEAQAEELGRQWATLAPTLAPLLSGPAPSWHWAGVRPPYVVGYEVAGR